MESHTNLFVESDNGLLKSKWELDRLGMYLSLYTLQYTRISNLKRRNTFAGPHVRGGVFATNESLNPMPTDAAALGPSGVLPLAVDKPPVVGIPPGDHSRAEYSSCTCERPGEADGVNDASTGEERREPARRLL